MAQQDSQYKIPSYRNQRALRNAKSREFSIIDKFKYGYRHREDQTNLPAGVLVEGSKNVLTNVSERIQCRQGYTLDGAKSTVLAPIASSYTYVNHNATENNLRSYIPTPNTGTLEYRYVNTVGTVSWHTLMSGLDSANFNYTTFWDTNEVKRVLLMVNGTNKIYEWNGAVTGIGAVGTNSITTIGSNSWAQLGFYITRDRSLLATNGSTFTYTGGWTTTTLTGVTPDPSSLAIASPITQSVVITSGGSLTSLALTNYDLISSLRNQVYIGQLNNLEVYISKVNDYKDYSFSDPRLVGEGAIAYLDAQPVAIVPLENSMNISAGLSEWYTIQWTLSSDLTAESVTVNRLKTNANAATQSQALTSAMKNDVIFVSQEPTLDRLGRVENILGTTQTTNISDPIKLDFDDYNFTDGSIYYNKYFIYLAVPKEGLIRIYNIVKSYWEAPQSIPISHFYTVAGDLYGHSYLTPESYKLFNGRADRADDATGDLGNPIDCKVVFSYQNYSTPFTSKGFNKYYVEGYISSNTTLTAGITYDIDGCATPTTYDIEGSDSAIVCIPNVDGNLGKVPLGKIKLGGDGGFTGELPPKFRVILTFPKQDFFEVQYSFESSQVNSNWELLRWGPALEQSPTIPTQITK